MKSTTGLSKIGCIGQQWQTFKNIHHKSSDLLSVSVLRLNKFIKTRTSHISLFFDQLSCFDKVKAPCKTFALESKKHLFDIFLGVNFNNISMP